MSYLEKRLTILKSHRLVADITTHRIATKNHALRDMKDPELNVSEQTHAASSARKLGQKERRISAAFSASPDDLTQTIAPQIVSEKQLDDAGTEYNTGKISRRPS